MSTSSSSEQSTRGPVDWPTALLLDLGISPDLLLVSLENLLFNEPSYNNANRRDISKLVVHVSARWLSESTSSGSLVGGIETAEAVLEALRAVEESTMLRSTKEEGPLRELLGEVQRVF